MSCDTFVGAGVPAGPPTTGTEAGRYNGKVWKMRDRTYEREHLVLSGTQTVTSSEPYRLLYKFEFNSSGHSLDHISQSL